MATASILQVHGKYWKQANNGYVFFVSTIAAGLAVPISNSTSLTPTVALWNPASSGRNCALIRYTAAYVSGTSVATPIALGYVASAGDAISTAGPFSAFNQSVLGTNLFNGQLGSGNVTKMRSSANGTNTLTAAPVYLMTMFGESALVATTAMNPYGVSYEFDGSVIVPPGVAVTLLATAATSALLAQTLWWEEIPLGS